MVSYNQLQILQREMEELYQQYRAGILNEQEYLLQIKPIDEDIADVEMAILQGSSALRVTSSTQARKPGS